VTAWAVVVAAGSGARFGGAKQYETLGGRRVLDWSLDAARQACEGVVLVVPADRLGAQDGATIVVSGGASRSESVRAGLAAVPPESDVVVVHDAARPLAGPDLFRAAIEAVRAGADGAVCAVAVTDTVKRVAGDVVVETLDRRELVSVQTPQAFRAATLRRAHAAGASATDDAALVEAIGGRVVVVPGHPRNLKLTTPGDLALAQHLLVP
jgi:2-C-methyl-D-erythritol 4-phosphate cytidylyltransferase